MDFFNTPVSVTGWFSLAAFLIQSTTLVVIWIQKLLVKRDLETYKTAAQTDEQFLKTVKEAQISQTERAAILREFMQSKLVKNAAAVAPILALALFTYSALDVTYSEKDVNFLIAAERQRLEGELERRFIEEARVDRAEYERKFFKMAREGLEQILLVKEELERRLEEELVQNFLAKKELERKLEEEILLNLAAKVELQRKLSSKELKQNLAAKAELEQNFFAKEKLERKLREELEQNSRAKDELQRKLYELKLLKKGQKSIITSID